MLNTSGLSLPHHVSGTYNELESFVSRAAANIPKNEVIYVREKLKMINQSMGDIGKSLAIPDENYIRRARALNRLSHKRCHFCLAKSGDILHSNQLVALQICQRCLLVYYCSDACRDNDIEKHSGWCCNQDATEYDRAHFMPIFTCRKLT